MKKKSSRYKLLLDHLSRVTNSNRYIPEVDGLRFFSIMTVVLLHMGTHLKRSMDIQFATPPSDTLIGWVSEKGGLGVDVFFAISGFILALPFINHYLKQGKKPKLDAYFTRRLTRLEPPYILTLIIFFVAQVQIGQLDFSAALPNFWASFFYLHNIIYDKMSIINPVAWSLEIEVQFYILAPLLFHSIFSIRKSIIRRIVIISAVIILVGINFAFSEIIEDLHLRKSLLAELHLFLIGVLLADYFIVSFDHQAKQQSYLFDLLGGISIVMLFYLRNSFDFFFELVFTFSIILLFLATFKGIFFNYFFRQKIIAVVGGMCYTIYLLHYPIIAFLTQITKQLQWSNSFTVNFLIQLVLVLPVVLGISAIFFWGIEKPCMKKDWHKTLFQRFKQTFLKIS